MSDYSFDEYENYYSFVGSSTQEDQLTQKELIQTSYDFLAEYIKYLSPIDRDIANFYYRDKISQESIAQLYNICQAAVSRRIKFILYRLKFLIKMPTQNPAQVREEFKVLFPKELFEYAFTFYFELTQNRVKNFIETSQSGASNKYFQIMEYLENIVAGCDDPNSEMYKLDDNVKYYAITYIEFFRFIHKNSNIFSNIFKKNVERRQKVYYSGTDVRKL